MPNWVRNHLKIKGARAQEVFEGLFTKDKGENICFDFNKIIPMPESLNIICGTVTDNCMEIYLTSVNPDVDYFGDKKLDKAEFLLCIEKVNSNNERQSYASTLTLEEIQNNSNNIFLSDIFDTERKSATLSEVLEYGKQAVENILTYGYRDWYDWCCAHWGTKWNACSTQIPNPGVAEVYFDTAWSPVNHLILELATRNPDCRFEYEFAEEQTGFWAGSFEYENGMETKQEVYPIGSKKCYEKYFELWGEDPNFQFNPKTQTYEYIEEEEEEIIE